MKQAAFRLAGLALAAWAPMAQAAPPVGLLAGAARVSIVPTAGVMKAPFTMVHDEIFVRTLVVDSGGRRAVMVVADVPMLSPEVSREYIEAIVAAAKVPEAHVFLSASHTHNTLRLDRKPGGVILPGSAAYVDQVKGALLQSLEQALARMQPARLGLGEGSAALVGAKSSWSAVHGRWIEKIDRSGGQNVSHALGVAKLETADGKPLAMIVNYGINPVLAMPLKGQISGDVPGYAARYMEQRTGNRAVAFFTLGASGNPLYRADDVQPSGYQAASADELIRAMGTVLGEEALAVAQSTAASDRPLTIAGTLRALECPGKITVPLNLPDRCAHDEVSALPACVFKDQDASPVVLKTGALRLGDLVIMHADADISAPVGMKLQARSPVAKIWVASLSYGPMHYVVQDSDYALNTYEATASTAKQGCAEKSFLASADLAIHALIDASAPPRGTAD
jgi:neutral ceramidase